MACSEYAAAIGGAGLVQHRCALRRRFPQRDGVDIELLAMMVHWAHPPRIGVNAALAITHYSVVRPTALPQRVDDLQIFVRQIIAVVMFHLRSEAHRARRTVEIAGDDVPADAAARQMIQ